MLCRLNRLHRVYVMCRLYRLYRLCRFDRLDKLHRLISEYSTGCNRTYIQAKKTILFCFEKVTFNRLSFSCWICIFLLKKMSRFVSKCHIYDMFVTSFCSNIIFWNYNITLNVSFQAKLWRFLAFLENCDF